MTVGYIANGKEWNEMFKEVPMLVGALLLLMALLTHNCVRLLYLQNLA